MDPDDWKNIRFFQVFFNSQFTGIEDPFKDLNSENPNWDSEIRMMGPDSELSTIPEGTETEDSFFVNDEADLAAWLAIDKDIVAATAEANKCCSQFSEDLPTTAGESGSEESPYDCDSSDEDTPPGDFSIASEVPDNYHITAYNVRREVEPEIDVDAEEEYLEIYYKGDMAKLPQLSMEDREGFPGKDEYLVEKVFRALPEKTPRTSKHKNKQFKKAVVDRADHILTPQETKDHWPEVIAAMKKELETWVKLKCISRKPRDTARNVIDVRWVLKWKQDAETQAADSTVESRKEWVIRARLCLRGFKDLDAKGLDSYAGTASRYTQRILVSEAVLRKWHLATTDISKAFLQGVTYEELAEATGEPLREVNFYLPAYCVPLLKTLPGWEDFDPTKEVIHCDKPGTGCNDAPRCFSLKLSKVTKDLCKMTSCTTDGELCCLHETHEGKLRLKAIIAKHVDDLKVTGDKEMIIYILKQIEVVFGQLKIDWNNFTNCGVRHRQDTDTMEVLLDQEEYIKGIKVCVHGDISGKGADTLACPELHAQYWSVLGAIAYAVLTRPDVAVFVAALQRFSHAPKIIHCKRLNAVVRWAQRNPKSIAYRQLDPKTVRPVGSVCVCPICAK